MKEPDHLGEKAAQAWAQIEFRYRQQGAWVEGPALDALANLVALERELASRIFSDGVMIQDQNENDVPHPALAVHRQILPQIITLEKHLDEKARPVDDGDPF